MISAATRSVRIETDIRRTVALVGFSCASIDFRLRHQPLGSQASADSARVSDFCCASTASDASTAFGSALSGCALSALSSLPAMLTPSSVPDAPQHIYHLSLGNHHVQVDGAIFGHRRQQIRQNLAAIEIS